MRRFGRVVAVVALVVAAAVAVPSAAYAVSAPPPPVIPVDDIPSRLLMAVEYQKNFPPGSAGYDEVAGEVRALYEMALKRQVKPSVPLPAPAPVAKPITPTKPFLRGVSAGGAAGGVLVAFQGGWAIGQAGLQLYGTISGRDQQKLMCDQAPDWYNSVNGFMTMGLASNCVAAIEFANEDVERFLAASYQGYTIGAPVGQLGNGDYCLPISWPAENGGTPYIPGATPPVQIYHQRTDGSWGVINITPPSGVRSCKNNFGSPMANSGNLKLGLGPVGVTVPASRLMEQEPNPQRSVGCSIVWSDGSTTTGAGNSYRESDGLPFSAEGLGCAQAWAAKPGAGVEHMPVRIKAESEKNGSLTTIHDSEVPAFSETDKLALDPFQSRGLTLSKTVAGVALSCMTWEADCAGWWSETENATTPGVYECAYGGVAVSLAECGVYRHTFDQRTDSPTITHPLTGEEIAWGARPDGQNSTDPSTGPTPGDQCMSEWPSAPNPIAWVAHPVKCALVWAFVPRAQVATAAQTSMMTAWAPTIVGQLPVIVGEVLTVPDGGSGCRGPHVVIPLKLPAFNIDTGYDGYPLSACEPPFSVLATWARVIGAAVLIWLTGLGIIRRASAIVNAPGVG